eukprot:CAMPEP_0168589908 /NCGR_PEP_ID=MMETSP0420-20121227/6270_1 /TAXON_ID=498008 /ORGANISM="Pessonella sp." /LENGTH=54 /DNA_ID=CAMNT_0008625501 /DNA_START=755 /DNA_END=919 /DNA_ORIENTATION=+
MTVQNAHFSSFIEELTSNTYLMVVMSDPDIQPAATQLNIQVARSHFETLFAQED